MTPTVAGAFWADGGMPVVAFGLFAIGALLTAGYLWARRTRTPTSATIGGLLIFNTIFGVYQNLWTQYIDWALVIPALFLIGAYAEGRVGSLTTSLRSRLGAWPATSRRLRNAAGLLAVGTIVVGSAAAFELLRPTVTPAVVPSRAAIVAIRVSFGSSDILVLPHGELARASSLRAGQCGQRSACPLARRVREETNDAPPVAMGQRRDAMPNNLQRALPGRRGVRCPPPIRRRCPLSVAATTDEDGNTHRSGRSAKRTLGP